MESRVSLYFHPIAQFDLRTTEVFNDILSNKLIDSKYLSKKELEAIDKIKSNTQINEYNHDYGANDGLRAFINDFSTINYDVAKNVSRLDTIDSLLFYYNHKLDQELRCIFNRLNLDFIVINKRWYSLGISLHLYPVNEDFTLETINRIQKGIIMPDFED